MPPLQPTKECSKQRTSRTHDDLRRGASISRILTGGGQGSKRGHAGNDSKVLMGKHRAKSAVVRCTQALGWQYMLLSRRAGADAAV